MYIYIYIYIYEYRKLKLTTPRPLNIGSAETAPCWRFMGSSKWSYK